MPPNKGLLPVYEESEMGFKREKRHSRKAFFERPIVLFEGPSRAVAPMIDRIFH